MRVGFAGLGLMGRPMALNILRAGFDLTVWNRDQSAAADLRSAGAAVAVNPADLGHCDVVCTSLPNGEVVESVLFGDEGVMGKAQLETLIIDFSTITASDARDLWSTCSKLGSGFVDAPVSGGPEGAKKGTLAIFVGGQDADVRRARPILEACGGAFAHMGGPGTGQVAKLANQIIIATTVLGLSEAFAYAQAEGVDAAQLHEILQAATADSAMLRTRVPVPGLQGEMPASNDWRPGFSAEFMAKDLGFALAGAAGVGVNVPGTALVFDLLQRVRDAGDGGCDWTIFSRYLSQIDSAGT